jgi:hypothetical protein
MNKPNTPILLAQELSAEEIKLQKAEETRNYRNKKENLNINDRLDLWNTTLYGEKVISTLNATNNIASNAKETKTQVKKDLLNLFS